MSSQIFLEHLRKAFNSPNTARDYIVFALLVLTIVGVCAFITRLQHRKKDNDDD